MSMERGSFDGDRKSALDAAKERGRAVERKLEVNERGRVIRPAPLPATASTPQFQPPIAHVARSAEEIRKDLEKLAQVQNVPVPEEPEEPEPAEEITDEIRALLESEDEGLGQMLNQFNTTARRERIERALAPLDVQDIIMHREMRQTVPVSCGVEVHFRTINGHESMQLLRYLGEQLSKSDTDLYIQELFANLRLAASTRGIGDMVFDHHMDARVLNKQRLQDKLDVILDYPQELLADMRVNCAWFALRVQRAMLGKALKNG